MAQIMVVDDERDVVTLIKFLLEKDGHRIAEAYNGVEALAKLGVEPVGDGMPAPNLIILDVLMPQMDGYTVCSKLAADKRTSAIPILILTAKGATRDLFSLSPNVAAHIDKPFDPKHLRELVSGMLAPKKGA
jgi:CheY-like chemotaxis protein